jgi:hypothetical protein
MTWVGASVVQGEKGTCSLYEWKEQHHYTKRHQISALATARSLNGWRCIVRIWEGDTKDERKKDASG